MIWLYILKMSLTAIHTVASKYPLLGMSRERTLENKEILETALLFLVTISAFQMEKASYLHGLVKGHEMLGEEW
jgi:hypothetical protein